MLSLSELYEHVWERSSACAREEKSTKIIQQLFIQASSTIINQFGEGKEPPPLVLVFFLVLFSGTNGHRCVSTTSREYSDCVGRM